MRPALAVVAARMRAGELPSAHEYGELLREADCDATEALALTRRYAAAVGSTTPHSGEVSMMAALRTFTLSHD